MLVDRASAHVVFMASAAGGMEIEEVAKKDPDSNSARNHSSRRSACSLIRRAKLAFGLGLSGEAANRAAPFLPGALSRVRGHRRLAARNQSLRVTGDGRLVALDAKMTFDDNGLFRHTELRDLRDLDEEDPLEVEASKYGLNYIKLDGTVACMVNGAGLAMATMDIIKYSGGSPANFLDVGGGASAEQVKNAFRILMSDPA